MDEQPNIRRMRRDELNAHAAERGVENPADYPNIDALADAVEALDAATAPTAPTAAEEEAEEEGGGEPEPEPDRPAPAGQRYRVLKAVTDEDGRTWMPGEEFVPDPRFPARRPKQLVDQKYLRPID
jgi:hypothetical protein